MAICNLHCLPAAIASTNGRAASHRLVRAHILTLRLQRGADCIGPRAFFAPIGRNWGALLQQTRALSFSTLASSWHEIIPSITARGRRSVSTDEHANGFLSHSVATQELEFDYRATEVAAHSWRSELHIDH
jgi:hypothetical protein